MNRKRTDNTIAKQSEVVNRKRTDNTIANHVIGQTIYILYLFIYRVKVFKSTFNNISVISWCSGLLVKEIREPGEHHRPLAIKLHRYREDMYV